VTLRIAPAGDRALGHVYARRNRMRPILDQRTNICPLGGGIGQRRVLKTAAPLFVCEPSDAARGGVIVVHDVPAEHDAEAAGRHLAREGGSRSRRSCSTSTAGRPGSHPVLALNP
jgi:hypothetical protein